MKTQKWLKTQGALQELKRKTKNWAKGFVTEFTEYQPITPYQAKHRVQWIPPYYGGNSMDYKTVIKGYWVLLDDEEVARQD